MSITSAIERNLVFLCSLLTLVTAACDDATAPGLGYVRVLVTTTGVDPDDSFEVSSDDINTSVIANVPSFFSMLEGPHSIELKGVANNCVVQGSSRISVDVAKNDTVRVQFTVGCGPLPRSGDIAFVDNLNNLNRLMLMSADGTAQAFLNDGSAPSWSADRKNLVYSTTQCSFYYYTCTGSLAIVDPLTRQITPLTVAQSGVDPDWSPTGNVIVYVEANSGFLYLYSIASSTRTRVIVGANIYVSHPSWSPDGEWIVAGCLESNVRRICIFDRNGSNIRYITGGTGQFNDAPAWSPDGNQIAFTSGFGGGSVITVIKPDGTDLRTLTNGSDPAWSPDSKQIVFTGYSPNGLYRINADGSGRINLTTGNHSRPAWR